MKTLNISAFFEKTLINGMAHHPVLYQVIGRKIIMQMNQENMNLPVIRVQSDGAHYRWRCFPVETT
ncbi:MAG: hypothetical protein ACI4UV_17070 [Victivallales bacterium]